MPTFARGQKLVLAAPIHSGLPAGASAVVAACARDQTGDGWSYDVTLTGVGRTGSGVQFVRAVPEEWLRSEGRIASAKSCAPVRFGSFALSAARLVVPLFQRRYCWDESNWARLWHVVLSPSSLAPHALGRIVFARDGEEHSSRPSRSPGSLVLVDGQQRCITLFLLLCAIRDVAAAELSAEHSAPIISFVERVLFTRRRRLTLPEDRASQKTANPPRGLPPPSTAHPTDIERGPAAACVAHPTATEQAGCGLESMLTAPGLAPAGMAHATDTERGPAPECIAHPTATEQAGYGLDSLPAAADVRLIPSRQDRLPFCSLVCRVPFDANASRAARTMHACHAFFLAQVRALVSTATTEVKGTATLTSGATCGARSCGEIGREFSSVASSGSERAAVAAGASEAGAGRSEVGAGKNLMGTGAGRIDVGTREAGADQSEVRAGRSDIDHKEAGTRAGRCEVDKSDVGRSGMRTGAGRSDAGKTEVGAGQSEVRAGRSEVGTGAGNREVGRSEVGRSDVGRSDVGRSEAGARVLSAVVNDCLKRVAVVAFELADKVALNNT